RSREPYGPRPVRAREPDRGPQGRRRGVSGPAQAEIQGAIARTGWEPRKGNARLTKALNRISILIGYQEASPVAARHGQPWLRICNERIARRAGVTKRADNCRRKRNPDGWIGDDARGADAVRTHDRSRHA